MIKTRLELNDRGLEQCYVRTNRWLFSWDAMERRNPFYVQQMGIWLENSGRVVVCKGGGITQSSSSCLLYTVGGTRWKTLPFFSGKVTLQVRGIGWRYWLKHQQTSLKFRVNHSFKVRYFVPEGYQLTRINRYCFRFHFWSRHSLKRTLAQIIRVQPTYAYKDVGIRLRCKMPVLKKQQKKLF